MKRLTFVLALCCAFPALAKDRKAPSAAPTIAEVRRLTRENTRLRAQLDRLELCYVDANCLPVTTVSDLPACNSSRKRLTLTVYDATAPTQHATLIGGGTATTRAFCDGTNWRAY